MVRERIELFSLHINPVESQTAPILTWTKRGLREDTMLFIPRGLQSTWIEIERQGRSYDDIRTISPLRLNCAVAAAAKPLKPP